MDKGYDNNRVYAECEERGCEPVIPLRGDGLPVVVVVERSHVRPGSAHRSPIGDDSDDVMHHEPPDQASEGDESGRMPEEAPIQTCDHGKERGVVENPGSRDPPLHLLVLGARHCLGLPALASG